MRYNGCYTFRMRFSFNNIYHVGHDTLKVLVIVVREKKKQYAIVIGHRFYNFYMDLQWIKKINAIFVSHWLTSIRTRNDFLGTQVPLVPINAHPPKMDGEYTIIKNICK